MSDFPQISFPEAVRAFLQDCRLRNLTPTTYEFYKYGLVTLEQFMKAHHLEFAQLTPFDLSNRYMNYMIDRQFASHTIRGRISTCQQFFKYLWQEGFLETNLAADFQLIRAEPKAIFTFSKEQVAAIFSPATGSAPPSKARCTWVSIKPGSSVRFPSSMISAPSLQPRPRIPLAAPPMQSLHSPPEPRL
ncbi:site-specific recombinase XerD [Paenibacillus forsythiae]|uniref:Site-specific recombinase XerD n=1 Tax=Paenibacillus forsythiae TaxID=365616 RepID=A0ABU3H4Y6_9BACL|nr:phage integrase N-terminal SAM-like domain-containing protein [Paenibacillus forsythiae]MDT3425883.1 site-specific recombinase XerD [Paenibacillus forsythiae]